MSSDTFEIEAACKSCNMTGLYVGLAERDGSAVVCHTCKGTGKITAEFERFSGRKERGGIRRVVPMNVEIMIGESGNYTLEDFGGMPYEDWAAGKPFPEGSEMRLFACPAWWYNRADYKKEPRWDKCTHGSYTGCEHFPEKAACWERWDREQVVERDG